MVAQTVAAFGRLDAAYNNAGVQNVLAETADTTREDYDRVMGINLRGEWSCMKFELRQMRKQGSGSIVNCSSLRGLVGGTQRGIYHAAKHGVLGFTKSAALEYATSDVLGTGWFAADAANVKPGGTVAVVGDGAVGLLGVLSAKQLGATRIIAMSRHETRTKLALEFGATDRSSRAFAAASPPGLPVPPARSSSRSRQFRLRSCSDLNAARDSRAQQRLDRPALVHCAITLRHLIEGQREVEHLAGVDRPLPYELDQLGQVAAHRGGPPWRRTWQKNSSWPSS